jgi:penicillin-binding protein 2
MARPVRIKDHHAEQRLFESRAIAAGVIMLLALIAIISRLFYLQVMQYDYFVALSAGNRIRVEPVPPNRGLILDRNGLPFATNSPSYQLELIREQVENIDDTLKRLVDIGLIEKEQIAILKKDIRGRRSFDHVPIKLQLTEVELARFAARGHDFPGIEIRPRLTRFYPLGVSSVHAIGYVGVISEDDKKDLDMNEYAGISLTGKTGVERAYEKELHGSAGSQQLLVNAQGRRVERIGRNSIELVRSEPVAGNDLFLTIDQRIQHVAEEELRGQRAAAIAIDPSNGDVLAFVSTPAFDPNLFVRGLARKDYLALTEDPDRPMLDRAIRGAYPPGSTVKPMMALAGLNYGVVSSARTVFCRGQFRLPRVSRPWRDWKPGGHGTVDMRKAIATSCDVYFYDLANMMGVDHIHDYLSQFGLGAITGIDIPGEKTGILPSTEWKRNNFRRKELQQWYPGDTISVGIGQGYMTATPLQLASYAATLAARGQRFAPRLVRAVRDVKTGAVRELPPKSLTPAKAADPAAWDIAIGGMIDVANAPYGTARGALAGAKYLIAGKSGTAQVFTAASNQRVKKANELVENLRDHALFVSFAPADAPMPRIALAIVVENAPGGGSAFAAPIARKMIDTYLLTPEELAAQQEAAKLKAAGKPPAPAAPVGRE